MVQILVIEYFHCCLLISLIIFYLRLHFMFDKRGGSWRLESNDIRFLSCFVLFSKAACIFYENERTQRQVKRSLDS